jgi:hypothetical protein
MNTNTVIVVNGLPPQLWGCQCGAEFESQEELDVHWKVRWGRGAVSGHAAGWVKE